MTTFDCIQGEGEWKQLHVGRVSASGLGNLVSPTFEIRKGEMPETYLNQKLAEGFKNRPIEDDEFGSHDTEHGQMMEDEARSLYCLSFKPKGTRLIDAGFCLHEDGRFGCSPDALIGEDSGLEIKCPRFKTHVGYLRKKQLPAAYAAQVHGSIYVTGRPTWVFMSFAKGFPPFVLTVHRDEKICATIAKALDGFYKKYDAAMAEMKGMKTA